MKNPQTILLPLLLPQELLSFLQGYLIRTEVSNLLFSLSFEVEGHFVALEVLSVDKNKDNKAHKVRLPLHYVLATADAADSDNPRFGFVQ